MDLGDVLSRLPLKVRRCKPCLDEYDDEQARRILKHQRAHAAISPDLGASGAELGEGILERIDGVRDLGEPRSDRSPHGQLYVVPRKRAAPEI